MIQSSLKALFSYKARAFSIFTMNVKKASTAAVRWINTIPFGSPKSKVLYIMKATAAKAAIVKGFLAETPKESINAHTDNNEKIIAVAFFITRPFCQSDTSKTLQIPKKLFGYFDYKNIINVLN